MLETIGIIWLSGFVGALPFALKISEFNRETIGLGVAVAAFWPAILSVDMFLAIKATLSKRA